MVDDQRLNIVELENMDNFFHQKWFRIEAVMVNTTGIL